MKENQLRELLPQTLEEFNDKPYIYYLCFLKNETSENFEEDFLEELEYKVKAISLKEVVIKHLKNPFGSPRDLTNRQLRYICSIYWVVTEPSIDAMELPLEDLMVFVESYLMREWEKRGYITKSFLKNQQKKYLPGVSVKRLLLALKSKKLIAPLRKSTSLKTKYSESICKGATYYNKCYYKNSRYTLLLP